MSARALILSGGGARGAYQAGVYRYLSEIDWKPDLISGTSVGAINACAIASGFDARKLQTFWLNIARDNVFAFSLWRKIWQFISRSGYSAVLDTAPLRKFLSNNIDLRSLGESDIEVAICAVNMLRSELRFFTNKEIGVDEIMASSAIPLLFPWQNVQGEPHWDGGIMANTPILPALRRGSREIVVVLLSPVGGTTMAIPKNRKGIAELMLEQSLLGSYQSFMAGIYAEKRMHEELREQGILGTLQSMIRPRIVSGETKILTVAPKRMLGVASMLNFSRTQAEDLLLLGYEDAKEQLDF
jgi:NTE family protein